MTNLDIGGSGAAPNATEPRPQVAATHVSAPSRDRKGVPHCPDGPPNRMKVSGTHFSELSRDREGADVPGTAAIRSLTVAARSLAWVTFNGADAEAQRARDFQRSGLTVVPIHPLPQGRGSDQHCVARQRSSAS